MPQIKMSLTSDLQLIKAKELLQTFDYDLAYQHTLIKHVWYSTYIPKKSDAKTIQALLKELNITSILVE
jgi:hypothetical protein